MNAIVENMNIPDDVWEDAAIEQLRIDISGYPGGAKAFVADNADRIGIGYFSFLDNLSGKSKIAYRTFSRTVHILGFTTAEYDERITQLIESKRRTSA